MSHANALISELPYVYAIVDPARDIETLDWLRASGLPHQCLFEGAKAVDLAEEAPHLVHFADQAGKLTDLLERFFGSACLSILVSRQPFYSVRRHLRRFLIVHDERREPLFFRYYDPRIGAAFLPTCDPHQGQVMFGDVIDAFWLESEEADAWLQLSNSGEGERPVTMAHHPLSA